MDGTVFAGPLPDSVIPYPSGLWNQLKYVFWRVLTPFFMYIQKTLLLLHLIHHEGRQDYVIGTIAPGKTMAELLEHLKKMGFGNHFIAWKDDDEVFGLRLLENFEKQYHIRIFSDREVRGHYEYTPEAHGIWHLQKKGQEARKEEFLNFIGDWVVPAE